MKELSIEEKAKAYDEAKLRMSAAYNSNRCTISFMNEIFPELKESEDERIRKSINRLIRYYHDVNFPTPEGFSRKDLLDWINKQSEQEPNKILDSSKLKPDPNPYWTMSPEYQLANEQKTADKVEPKFKVGDWVVSPNGVYWYIDAINNNRYEVSSFDGAHADWPLNTDLYRLWTIQDAKDGDVLVNWNDTIFIFKNIEDDVVKYYIAYYEKWDEEIRIPSSNDSHVELAESQFKFKPATKEQRDLLFQKMKEAGYEWDANKKELKKIKQESTWNEKIKGLNELETYILALVPDMPLNAVKVDAKNIRYIINKEQKSSWSEEDEDILNTIINHFKIDIECTDEDDTVRWLKSLKDRVQPQPQQEWSEEDERIRQDIENLIHFALEDGSAVSPAANTTKEKAISWIQFLKDRYTWKPSGRQMSVLEYYMHTLACNEHKEILFGLYQDLKKLKG